MVFYVRDSRTVNTFILHLSSREQKAAGAAGWIAHFNREVFTLTPNTAALLPPNLFDSDLDQCAPISNMLLSKRKIAITSAGDKRSSNHTKEG